MLNINEFKSAVQKYDLERPNLFKVEFSPPEFLREPENKDILSYVDNGKHVSLLCRSASMPGRSLALADTRRYGIGPSIKMPIGGSLEEFTLTFMNDADSRTWLFFHKWLDYIYPMGTRANNQDVVPGQLSNHQLKFKKRYQTTMDLVTYHGERGKFSGSGLISALVSAASAAAGVPFVGALLNSNSVKKFNLKEKRRVTFYKVFPVSLSSIAYSADQADAISEFTVGFTYVNYAGTLKF